MSNGHHLQAEEIIELMRKILRELKDINGNIV